MSTPPEVRVTAYAVSCLPEDNVNAYHFTLKVEYRGYGKWAVLIGPYCYSADGEYDYEPSSSSRTDEWLATHRFDLDEALELAQRCAPLMTVNGHTVADALLDKEARKTP